MAIQSNTPLAVTSAATIFFFFFTIVTAAPTSIDSESRSSNVITLIKRKPILKDSDQLSLDHKVPADAILLVGAGLVAALLCLCVALWNLYAPNASGNKRVREERAQAKTELRLKGGGGGSTGSASPTRNMMEKKRHQSNGTVATDFLSHDSHSKLLTNMPSPGRFGPKIATDFPRNSRAARGYSSYSMSSISKMGPNHSNSMLAVPTLASNAAAAAAAADNASLPGCSTSSGSNSNTHNQPWRTTRPSALQDRSDSYNSQTRRTSTTLGRGVDLNVNRSKSAKTKSIHVNPQAVDPTYFNQHRLSHQANASNELQDPLTGFELKRFTTDPSENLEGSRRNSSMNALDFFGYGSGGNPIYANRTYNDSGSDSVGHEMADARPSTPNAIPRTKQMTFYDADRDGFQSPHRQQEHALLGTTQYYQNSKNASPTKSDRMVWGNRF